MIHIEPLSENNIGGALWLLNKQFGDDQYSRANFDLWLPASIPGHPDGLALLNKHGLNLVKYWVAFDLLRTEVCGVTGIFTKKGQDDLAWLGWTSALDSSAMEDTLVQFSANMARSNGKLYLADFLDDGDGDDQLKKMLSRNKFYLHDMQEASEAPEDSVHYRMDLLLPN